VNKLNSRRLWNVLVTGGGAQQSSESRDSSLREIALPQKKAARSRGSCGGVTLTVEVERRHSSSAADDADNDDDDDNLYEGSISDSASDGDTAAGCSEVCFLHLLLTL